MKAETKYRIFTCFSKFIHFFSFLANAVTSSSMVDHRRMIHDGWSIIILLVLSFWKLLNFLNVLHSLLIHGSLSCPETAGYSRFAAVNQSRLFLPFNEPLNPYIVRLFILRYVGVVNSMFERIIPHDEMICAQHILPLLFRYVFLQVSHSLLSLILSESPI